MATYVIGDVHGSYHTLMALLALVGYRSGRDRVWLVGDLVNNGPSSTKIVRWAMEREDHVTCVLGNHDLHMLAVAAGVRAARPGRDTFIDVLRAPDADKLVDWMRRRPLLHVEEGPHGPDIMVHAGLLPEWDLETAQRAAGLVSSMLHDPDRWMGLVSSMYGNEPVRWRDAHDDVARRRVTINALTRLRMCRRDGSMEFRYKGELVEHPPELIPWFRHPERKIREGRIFFGHWSAIGYMHEGNIFALDSGCTWGKKLTAYCLDDGRVAQLTTRPGDGAAEDHVES